MEAEVTQAPLTEEQLYSRAVYLMAHEGRSPEEVYNKLVAEGAEAESANAVVGNIELEISTAKKKKAQKDMLYGALWCIGGTVMTLANVGFIFWGAIVFGAIQFFRGAANA